MDITNFFFSRRQEALVTGDYNSYRAQSARRLHTLRKKLGQTTPKGRKYTPKAPITAENVHENQAYAQILILLSERAWAQAMHMKASHSANSSAKEITGATRSHIISRLTKASGYAQSLVSVLKDQATSGATDTDVVEARAYWALISGALYMERRRWDQCLESYSLARVIYSTLETKVNNDAYGDLISDTIDPSLRYAAYQLKIPRTRDLPSLAIERFPSDAEIRADVEKIDPSSLVEQQAGTTKGPDGSVQKLPDRISWRSRTVPIEDASIGQALAAAAAAEANLSTWLSETGERASPKEQAAAYDNVILASQEAVDATKTALAELTSEGVDPGDPRVQALQVTRTAVSYSSVGWRVGRNRVLAGPQDGLADEFAGRQRKSKPGKTTSQAATGKRLSRLREKVTLYDSILQSLDVIQELPGVAGDVEFVGELESKRTYFRALRCIAIGRFYSLQGNERNALALFARALELVTAIRPGSLPEAAEKPPRLDVSSQQVQIIGATLQGLIARHRGLVTLDQLSQATQATSESLRSQRSLVERLDEYSADDLDANRLVPFPPRMQPVPVKPLFLDVAWNYIQYPRETPKKAAVESKDDTKPARRGWFSFGRS